MVGEMPMGLTRRKFLKVASLSLLAPNILVTACSNTKSLPLVEEALEASPVFPSSKLAVLIPSSSTAIADDITPSAPWVVEPTATMTPGPDPTIEPTTEPTLDLAAADSGNPKTAPTRIPTVAPNRRSKLNQQFIWQGNPEKPNMALTFDDAWRLEDILRFIQVLKKTRTQLTVFPLGQAMDAFRTRAFYKNYRGLMKELYDLGCEFGCHSYAHEKDSASRSVDFMIESIDRSQTALDSALGLHVPYRYFRPPGGGTSWNLVEALDRTGLTGIIWTLISDGINRTATPASVYRRVSNNPGRGYIVLHHFHPNDTLALERIIISLRSRGFNPTTLSQTL
jgi:peptidoglycan/xylan/chitin deacetylase (PgdA/CDA1 family)